MTADRAAQALVDAVARLVAVTPAGWSTGRGNVRGLAGGSAVASLNAVVSTAAEPDPAALDAVATELGALGLPWSILVREAAGDAVAAVAARHGLSHRDESPLMVCDAGDAVLTSDEHRSTLIHRVGAARSDAYTAALAAGFGVPDGVFGSLMGGGVLDAPGFTGYLAGEPGGPVATGLGVTGHGMVGVFNITVDPSRRGHGLGRAMTARVLADGFAAGCTTAYLQTSEDGRALYESMGFRLVENWAVFTTGA
ncbi:GNAT family N-acetyltransferase [Actinoplanes sp. NPDC051494]|uniref:GNAT family N-acetyltransferase n=1 Tax=Actinoplanes sp. NPDC051494 TaxID=3363907 RepID=UPI00378D9828